MPDFDHMLDAVRADCDLAVLRSPAELRGLSARRTTVHRAVGGAVALTAIAGLTTGLVFYGPGGGVPASSGVPLASASSSAQVSPTVTSPPLRPGGSTSVPSISGPPVSPAQVLPPPVSPDPQRSTQPAAGCTVASFDTAHATKADDDASGIIGYDIGVRYRGRNVCPISGTPRMAYTDSAGHRVVIPQDPPPSGHHSIKHGGTLTLTVYGRDHNGENPLPPSCAQPTTYRGISIEINGQWAALPGLTAMLPCGSPTTTWLIP